MDIEADANVKGLVTILERGLNALSAAFHLLQPFSFSLR